MISSANPGLKSFIISLATVISQTNKKVLVIDADMRKGYIHSRFGLRNKIGLSDYLSGTTELNNILQNTKSEKLDVITRGNVPTNPSELLMSKRFQDMLSLYEGSYDYILIDTPPILAVTDPAIIGRYCGISILVTRFDSCTMKQVKEAYNRFRINGIDIKGVVFNAIKGKAAIIMIGYYNYEYGIILQGLKLLHISLL